MVAQSYRKITEARKKQKKTGSPQNLQKRTPNDILISSLMNEIHVEFLAYRTVIRQLCIVLSYEICGKLLKQEQVISTGNLWEPGV